jgi:gas vesicle protein
LQDRRLSLSELREIVGAVTSGVGSGLNARGGEVKAGLKQAVDGLDDAIGGAAEAVSLTLREAVSQGREFKDSELKETLERLRDLEGQFVDTLKDAAQKSSGKLKEGWSSMAEHLSQTGTRTGERVRESLTQLSQGVKTSSAAGQSGVKQAVEVAGERLAHIASGVLEALSDSLKRQSDRLR